MPYTTKDIAWLAGFLEGEGCFTVNTGRTPGGGITPCPQISFSGTDLDVMQRASMMLRGFQGRLTEVHGKHVKPHFKQAYHTAISGNVAAAWMMTLYSLMGARRRARIKEVLAFWRAYQGRRMGGPKCHPWRGSHGGGLCGPCKYNPPQETAA
jgi:hypothetical protein